MVIISTILALSIAGSLDPLALVSAASLVPPPRPGFSGLSLSRFASSFISSSALHESEFAHSQFRHFLSTAIALDSTVLERRRFVNRRYTPPSSNLTLLSCSFLLCRNVGQPGGALLLLHVSCRASDCQFRRNSAAFGSAICVIGAPDFAVLGCMFAENDAGGSAANASERGNYRGSSNVIEWKWRH
jgi:hypothetical protein